MQNTQPEKQIQQIKQSKSHVKTHWLRKIIANVQAGQPCSSCHGVK